MNSRLKALRDAVLGPSSRRVEVGPDGEVRELASEPAAREGKDSEKPATPTEPKATRLAPRVFGHITTAGGQG